MESIDHIMPPKPTPVPYRPVAVRHGIYLGLASVVIGLTSQLVLDPSELSSTGAKFGAGLIFMALGLMATIVLIAMAVKYHRDVELGGYISFSVIVMIGLIMGVVAGAIESIFNIINMYVINPEQLESIHAAIETSFETQDMDDEQIDVARRIARIFTNPFVLSFLTVLSKGVSGMFWGLIVALFMQKERPKA